MLAEMWLASALWVYLQIRCSSKFYKSAEYGCTACEGPKTCLLSFHAACQHELGWLSLPKKNLLQVSYCLVNCTPKSEHVGVQQISWPSVVDCILDRHDWTLYLESKSSLMWQDLKGGASKAGGWLTFGKFLELLKEHNSQHIERDFSR